LGLVIGELAEDDALHLEVHQAYDVPHAGTPSPVLPRYLFRTGFDDRLRDLVASAEAKSRLVLVVGDSSTGKTRACWEAIRDRLPEWRVWHPLIPERPAALVSELATRRLAPRTVIWLNDAHDYLLPRPAGILAATTLQDLLTDPNRGPVLVLASIWPRERRMLTAPSADSDACAAMQGLLNLAAEVAVPAVFTDDQLADMSGLIAADPRLELAVNQAVDRRITQFLAGAPELKRRYDQAEPPERAVLQAAIDARRLGCGPLLPEPFLRAAAPGYIDTLDWDQLSPDDWFAHTMQSLGAGYRGLPGPLVTSHPRPDDPPQPGRSYRLADYLEQYGQAARRWACPPASFWDAALNHARNSTDQVALARAARSRGRFSYHELLIDRAAGADDPTALSLEAGRAAEAAQWENAERLYRKASDAGNAGALTWLAGWLVNARKLADAERLYREAAHAGNPVGMKGLAGLLEKAGNAAEAERWYKKAADTGDSHALTLLAGRRVEAGQWAAAGKLALAAARAGDRYYLTTFADRLMGAGHAAEAEKLYKAAAAAGDAHALHVLAEQHAEAGRHGEARLLASQAAARGKPDSLRFLAMRLEEVGQAAEAEQLYKEAGAAGDNHALVLLAFMLVKMDKWAEATRMAAAAAQTGNPNVLAVLARLREEAGSWEEAELLYKEAGDAGHAGALYTLARKRAEAGQWGEARRLGSSTAKAGYPRALTWLASELEKAGQAAEAEQVYKEAIGTGDMIVIGEIADRRRKAGRLLEAEKLYLMLLDSGQLDPDPYADDYKSTDRMLVLLDSVRKERGEHGVPHSSAYGLTADGQAETKWH
jgi:hypothetical protein